MILGNSQKPPSTTQLGDISPRSAAPRIGLPLAPTSLMTPR
jgi:hypothetical protein